MRIQRKAVMLLAASSMLMSVALSAPTALAEPPGGEPDTPAITQTVTPSGPQQPGDQPPATGSEQPSTTTPDSQDQTEPSTPGEEPSTNTSSSEAPTTSEAPSTSAPPSQAPGKRLAPAAVAAGCQTYPPTSFQVCGRIKDKYNQTGGPTGFLLFPKSNELTNPGNTGKRTEFLGGNIYWSAATDAHPVAHEFLTKWGEKGYETGYLKYPTTDEIVLPGTINRRQEYQGGSIYWAAGIGAHTIQGAIKDKWLALGGYNGALGYPTSDEIVAPDGIGRFHKFQNGSIYWSPSTGAHPVSGIVLAEWALAGYEQGTYGYPTSDQYTNAGGYIQDFQHGSIDHAFVNQAAKKVVGDCDLTVDPPLMQGSTNWVTTTASADCKHDHEMEVRWKLFWTPPGSDKEILKYEGVETTQGSESKTVSDSIPSPCFDGTYRVSTRFKVWLNGGQQAPFETPVNSGGQVMGGCQGGNAICPQPIGGVEQISDEDCQEAIRVVLYARFFQLEAKPGMNGKKQYRDDLHHLPTPSDVWYEYDVWPQGSNPLRADERVLIDIGKGPTSDAWFSKDHYKTQEGWVLLPVVP